MKKEERPTITTLQTLLPLQQSNSQKISLNTSYSSPTLPTFLSNHKSLKLDKTKRHEV